MNDIVCDEKSPVDVCIAHGSIPSLYSQILVHSISISPFLISSSSRRKKAGRYRLCVVVHGSTQAALVMRKTLVGLGVCAHRLLVVT